MVIIWEKVKNWKQYEENTGHIKDGPTYTKTAISVGGPDGKRFIHNHVHMVVISRIKTRNRRKKVKDALLNNEQIYITSTYDRL